MMRRIYLLAALVFLVAVLLAVVLGRGSDSKIPRFVAGTPVTIPGFKVDYYEWLADAPFEDGKLWLWTYGLTNAHQYLYDLDRRAIVGELFDAAIPILRTRDNSRLLCQGPDSPATTLKAGLMGTLGKIFGRPWRASNRDETFWVLDLPNNSATKVGTLAQFPGTGSRWHSSPSGRFGYTMPSTAFGNWFVLCDLQSKSFRRIPIQGELQGWWSDQELLVASGRNTFLAFDISTRKTRVLFSPKTIHEFLRQADLRESPGGIGTLAIWNGREYDIYLGPKDDINGLRETNSFLLKAERAGPALQLVYRDFKFQWGGWLDKTATLYLYQGESGKPGSSGNGAVYLRNLTNGTTSMIVAPDTNGQYAIPRFYGNEVIYFRNRLLNRIKLEGNDDALLLPPGGR